MCTCIRSCFAPFDKCFPVIVIALCSDASPPHPDHARVALQDVQQHYEALLQMYGEKAEEAEELKMDIQDLKSLYRQQVSGRESVCVCVWYIVCVQAVGQCAW